MPGSTSWPATSTTTMMPATARRARRMTPRYVSGSPPGRNFWRGSCSRRTLERVAHAQPGRAALDEREQLAHAGALAPAPVAHVPAAGLRALGLLRIRRPEDLLRARMPAEVDLVQAIVVREEDDLGGHLRLRRLARAGVELAEQLV